MGITSFYFLCFFALVLIAYYTIPLLFKKRGQWVVLLFASIIFYLFSVNGNYVQIVFPLAASFTTWGLLKLLAGTEEKELLKRRLILVAELVVLLGILIVFKFYKFKQVAVLHLLRDFHSILLFFWDTLLKFITASELEETVFLRQLSSVCSFRLWFKDLL